MGFTLALTDTIEPGTFVNTAYPLELHLSSGSIKYSDSCFKPVSF